MGLAIELDEEYWQREGRPLPLFAQPAAGLYMLAAVIRASRHQAAEQHDPQAITLLDEIEETTIDRVHALASVHPDPDVSALAVEIIPRQARRRGDTAPQTLFDVARQFSRKVPLAKLVLLEDDVRPYMACVIVDAVRSAGETLLVPADLKVAQVPPE